MLPGQQLDGFSAIYMPSVHFQPPWQFREVLSSVCFPGKDTEEARPSPIPLFLDPRALPQMMYSPWRKKSREVDIPTLGFRGFMDAPVATSHDSILALLQIRKYLEILKSGSTLTPKP